MHGLTVELCIPKSWATLCRFHFINRIVFYNGNERLTSSLNFPTLHQQVSLSTESPFISWSDVGTVGQHFSLLCHNNTEANEESDKLSVLSDLRWGGLEWLCPFLQVSLSGDAVHSCSHFVRHEKSRMGFQRWCVKSRSELRKKNRRTSNGWPPYQVTVPCLFYPFAPPLSQMWGWCWNAKVSPFFNHDILNVTFTNLLKVKSNPTRESQDIISKTNFFITIPARQNMPFFKSLFG